MVGDDLRAAEVAVGDLAHEAARHRELAEGAVDDDHLVDVRSLVGTGRGGHGRSSWVGWMCCVSLVTDAVPAHSAPTLAPGDRADSAATPVTAGGGLRRTVRIRGWCPLTPVATAVWRTRHMIARSTTTKWHSTVSSLGRQGNQGKVHHHPGPSKDSRPPCAGRSTRLISWTGVIIAAVLLVAGGLLLWASSFATANVHDQFASQQITMPVAAALTTPR